MTTLIASRRDDRRKNPTCRLYHLLTMAECRDLHAGQRVDAVDMNGDVVTITVTSVKTWKTRPDVHVRWKFGLRTFGTLALSTDDDNDMLVSAVE